MLTNCIDLSLGPVFDTFKLEVTSFQDQDRKPVSFITVDSFLNVQNIVFMKSFVCCISLVYKFEITGLGFFISCVMDPCTFNGVSLTYKRFGSQIGHLGIHLYGWEPSQIMSSSSCNLSPCFITTSPSVLSY